MEVARPHNLAKKKGCGKAGQSGPHKLQAASLTRRILNDKVKTMTTINYNNKKMKLPFEIKSHSAAMVKRTNPLSGESLNCLASQPVYTITQCIKHLAESWTS